MGVDPLEKRESTPLSGEQIGTVVEGKLAPKPVAPPPSRSSVIQELIQQAMIGVLPTRRPLRVDEPNCFNSTHFAMIYDSVNGASAAEIAARYNYGQAQVARILAHPYTEVIEAALMGKMADDLTDPIARMRAYAHESIDVKVQIMRDPATPKTLKNIVASDFLDRVGFGARKVVSLEDNRDKEAPVPSQLMERFTNALEKSNEVRKLGFGSFVKQGEGAVAVKDGSQDEGGALPSASGDSGGASPAGGPRTLEQREEKVA